MGASSDSRHWEPGEPLSAERINDVAFWPENGREIELLIMELRGSRAAVEAAKEQAAAIVSVKADEAAYLASDRCEACGHLTALHNGHCCVFCMVPGCTCEWSEVRTSPAIPDKG